jgi:hypothetical protein
MGKEEFSVPHLEGRSNSVSFGYHSISTTDNRTKLEWIIQAQEGQNISLKAHGGKSGIATTSYTIPKT